MSYIKEHPYAEKGLMEVNQGMGPNKSGSNMKPHVDLDGPKGFRLESGFVADCKQVSYLVEKIGSENTSCR
ncbi:hypothetical protein P618_200739 [Holospora obtusa F1]|uniref:Uncharacterized protein n=1 Tax=Holospora obtusa F1 TaxID=1399147 RepID=W6TGR0_HOLOB|nr:hypothetical protein [Holospora obtusa]ETZ07110.1 hypothetical protein P618_200739 [Holospora obtusa F1]